MSAPLKVVTIECIERDVTCLNERVFIKTMNHLLTNCSQSTLLTMVCRLSLLVLNKANRQSVKDYVMQSNESLGVFRLIFPSPGLADGLWLAESTQVGHGLCHTFIESCPQGVLWTVRVVIQPESSGWLPPPHPKFFSFHCGQSIVLKLCSIVSYLGVSMRYGDFWCCWAIKAAFVDICLMFKENTHYLNVPMQSGCHQSLQISDSILIL